MKLAVIDTNVIIAAQLTRHDDAATRRIVKAVFDGIVTPVATPAILAEYAEVMSRPKFCIAPETVSTVVRYFRTPTKRTGCFSKRCWLCLTRMPSL